MVFAYVLTSRLNAASQFVGIDRDHNAKVLSQAKRALIGWMAINAAGTDNNPGRLPCPQAWGDVGGVNEGRAAGNCGAPAAGWLPWRTLGLQKPLDSSGNQIWYVISPGWHLPSAGATLTINSDTAGQLTLDGQAAVALLIAPGPPLAIAPNANQVAAGCAPRNQSQVIALPGTDPIPLDFLECQNGSTADSVFTASVVDNAANPVFNDQVAAVTAADVLPALEAAIAERMQREIAPALRTVYTSSQYAGIPASSPMYPYAATFSNPGSASFQGVAGLYRGLLPTNQASSMVAYASTPGDAIETLGNGSIEPGQSCFWETANEVRVCEGIYKEDTDAGESSKPIRIQMSATFTNVAMGLRAIDTTRFQVYARDNSGSPPWALVTVDDYTATMNSNGSVTARFSALMPNIDVMSWGTRAEFRIRIERSIIDDHALVKSGDATYGWFVRNLWHRVLYYAVAEKNTAGALSAFGCTDTSSAPNNCLRYIVSGTYNVRALLVLAGQSLSNPAGRPNGVLADYIEYQNCDLFGGVCDPRTLFEQRPMRSSKVAIAALNAPWNDRVVLVDWIGSLIVPSQAVTLSPLRIATLP